jgi:hypothetical protein
MKSGQTPKTSAQQIAQEPLEVLNETKGQVFGENPQTPRETSQQPQSQDVQGGTDLNKPVSEDQARSQRMLGALEKEIGEIRRQNLFKDLQAQISEGAKPPLEDIAELTMEQKQVLKAQMEAYQAQKPSAESLNRGVLVEPATRRGRKLFDFGKKQAVKQEQTRVEKPVQSSV